MFKRVLPVVRDFAAHHQPEAHTCGFQLDVFEVDAGDNMGLVNEHEVLAVQHRLCYAYDAYECFSIMCVAGIRSTGSFSV